MRPKSLPVIYSFFFFNDTAPTEIYTLSLHDALPICLACLRYDLSKLRAKGLALKVVKSRRHRLRSEEHTSELQSQSNLVCRLLLEKKKESSRLLQDMTEQIGLRSKKKRSRLTLRYLI